MSKDYKALLTVYGLDEMTPKQIKELKDWLRKIANQVGKEQYARIARFRLMK